MIKKIILLLSMVLIFKCEEKFGLPAEDNVVVLTTNNFDEFIKKHKMVMVEFYAPWCGHCKSLAPKYSTLAKNMADKHNIPVAKVDATVEKDLGSKYQVKGYPSIKLFINGSSIDYKGERETKNMEDFIVKKMVDATVEIQSNYELDTLKKDNKVLIVYFGEENNTFNNYKISALTFETIKFVHVFDKDLFEKYKVDTNTVILFKNFDEKENRFQGEFTTENLNDFIEFNRYPILMEFDQEAAEKIFGKQESAIFLFQDTKSDLHDIFLETAKNKRDKINFSTSTVSSGLGAKLAEYVGITQKDAPCIRIVNFKDQNLDKFKMTEEFNKENLNKFIDDFHSGKLTKYFKSEEIPEKNDAPVKVVVGNNFEKLVLDDSKHVLLEAYAPWCGHCKKLEPIYNELGEKLKNNSEIIIAKMDATANEYSGFEIKSFPTIKLYKKGNKSTPIEYDGERTLEGLLKFLEKNTELKKGDL